MLFKSSIKVTSEVGLIESLIFFDDNGKKKGKNKLFM